MFLQAIKLIISASNCCNLPQWNIISENLTNKIIPNENANIHHTGGGTEVEIQLPSWAVASPAQKKWGGPNNFSLLVSSKKLQYTCMGPPSPIYKTLLNGFAQISGGVWTEVGGPDPPIPPVATPLILGKMLNSSVVVLSMSVAAICAAAQLIFLFGHTRLAV